MASSKRCVPQAHNMLYLSRNTAKSVVESRRSLRWPASSGMPHAHELMQTCGYRIQHASRSSRCSQNPLHVTTRGCRDTQNVVAANGDGRTY
eukprot:COSAG02_NODE_6458_length_3558_cov_2.844753_4_plen_92_part_00